MHGETVKLKKKRGCDVPKYHKIAAYKKVKKRTAETYHFG